MQITKLFAVVALMGSPAVAETQHPAGESRPTKPVTKPRPEHGKQDNGKPVPPKPTPAPAMQARPRVTANGRPACGNVASRAARSSDCKP